MASEKVIFFQHDDLNSYYEAEKPAKKAVSHAGAIPNGVTEAMIGHPIEGDFFDYLHLHL